MPIPHAHYGSATAGRWIVAGAAALLIMAFCCGFARRAAAQDEPKPKTPQRIGRFIHVPLPITGQTFERTRRMVRRAIEKAKQENARLVLVFEFDVPKGQKSFGRGSDFGAAHDLASFISSEELSAVRTAAYLPRPIEGHAVLPAIACEEIIMAQSASIGAAGIDEKIITPTQRSAYTEIAGRRRTVPTPLALGMLDRAIKVLRVETEVGPEFVTTEGLEELKKRRAAKQPEVVKRAGEPGVFSGEDARRMGFASYLADNRRGVADALELPPTALVDDPSLEGDWRAVRVDLQGPIRSDSVDRAQRMIEDQVRDHNANFVCLWIDSPGGSLVDAMRMANFLAFDLDPGRVRTVAYVPNEALSDAAIVALACDQLVVHPRAKLGGPGAGQPSKEEIDDALQVISKELAPRKGRSWSLMAAMIDPNLNVFRCTRLGDVEYFSDEELKGQPAPEQWKKETLVTTPGAPLELSGDQAERYHLANRVVDDFAGFKKYYGLENDPTLVEPGWADILIRALASPGVAVLLLLCGGAGLYIELHSPGIGVGGFLAAVCFLLFFWSRYLGGTAGWLEASLFIAGVSCLLMELFVLPGFGIFGLGGGTMVLTSLVLASQTFVWPKNEYQFGQLQRSLLSIAGAMVGIIVIAVLLRHRLPRSRLFGHFLLEPPVGEEAETIGRREALVDFNDLVGQRGTVATQLTPGGKARFGDLLVDVIADGELIERGAAVEVVKVRGNRVLVKVVDSG
ncbi:MAG: hypothetical protein KKE86_14795 [Planctomycetes bacterium]|nr:hypothetical protein [Planctomycetota bacterium]MBU4400588.1 hypothetical protein [Planctomycetota bacterium]MCG2682031.1 hypothetical protein [Planctomycetales bacterium]